MHNEAEIVGWKNKRSSEKKMSIAIYDILSENGYSQDKGSPYAESIVKKLKASNIDCQQASADRIDLFDILRALRTIIIHEKGNHILVNVSVGSKIQAIASMMACMMFKDMATIKPYYVVVYVCVHVHVLTYFLKSFSGQYLFILNYVITDH